VQRALEFSNDYALGGAEDSWGRRLAVTENRYPSLVPSDAKVGNPICVFLGGQITFVIRSSGDHLQFRSIRECFVQDFMDGEIMIALEQGQVSSQDFVLIQTTMT